MWMQVNRYQLLETVENTQHDLIYTSSFGTMDIQSTLKNSSILNKVFFLRSLYLNLRTILRNEKIR